MLDENEFIRFTWNSLPSNRVDATQLVVPVGFHYSPCKTTENLSILDYDPVQCAQCKSVLNPYFQIDFRNKSWICAFCSTRNTFKGSYAEFLNENNLAPELYKENSTVDYRLTKKEANWPIFLFVIDTALEEDDLNELKDSIQQVITTLPPDCSIGIITYGAMCHVHELGNTEFSVSYSFKGDKHYKTLEIQEQLGLATINRNLKPTDPKKDGMSHVSYNTQNKFIVPLKDAEYTITTFLDELYPDPWKKKQGERPLSCGGLAIHVAISLLDVIAHSDPCRVLFFVGGAPCIGQGQIVGPSLSETIRMYLDFEKNNSNTQYYAKALEFYTLLATRAAKTGIVVDLFACALDQVGVYEMKVLVEKTGGCLIESDSFATMVFKDSFRKLFNLDESNNLKMSFKGKNEIYTTDPVKISGALGYMHSMETTGKNVSEIKFGEGGTKQWYLGGLDENSTHTYFLDINGTVNTNKAIIQIVTQYIGGDRSHHLRVTTVQKQIVGSLLNNTNALSQIGQSFDQEAATVMIARMAVHKGATEEIGEILKWVDKSLIKIISKFAHFRKDDIKSFKLSPQFSYFPQFLFYLRRSRFIQHFNASPDEISYYKTHVMKENVNNSTIMIQPMLFAYTADSPEPTPVFLDVESMKPETVLLMDSFFTVVVWHGEEVCVWRENEYHLQPEYENIKQMLENPVEYAQQIIAERFPVPKYVSCDSGSGPERLLKFGLNPSSTSNSSKMVQECFVSDDVSLKAFMDFLIKLVVQS